MFKVMRTQIDVVLDHGFRTTTLVLVEARDLADMWDGEVIYYGLTNA